MMPRRENAPMPETTAHLLHGLSVLERGWLSSNNILIHAAQGEAGAVLVDTGHLNHAEQTLALVRHALAGQPLARILNTHLHSDHCGGNTTLQAAFPGVPLAVPPGQSQAVRSWDEDALSYRGTDQRVQRFDWQQLLRPGESMTAGARDWQVLAAPGHDPHSVMLFEPEHGVLISADALWGNGFGVVFPETVGEPGFDDVAATLDLIDSLPARVVIPGHGAPFVDVKPALARARSRLAAFVAQPQRHARYAVKALTKYHLMEEGSQPLPELLKWVASTPLLAGVQRQFVPHAEAPVWIEGLVAELVAQGALALRDGVVFDA
jgi:glyoxylase-like metal-dependent hydrolase (beta-lactamase superfamily II)